MSKFIRRNLLDKTPRRGSNFEQLLDGFRKRTEEEAEREEAREEARKGEQEEHEPGRRGLPSGFAFRRRMNH